MHKYIIILLLLLSLSLGITFAVLKVQNDKDIKLNPNAPNYSTVYTWLSNISFISFILFLSTLFAIYIFNNYRPHKLLPLLSLVSLTLVITFGVLKQQNEIDISLNPNTPKYSTLYTWLLIIFLLIFLSTINIIFQIR